MRTISRKSQQGFTIVELLIVITVIAILASVAMPNYLHARKAANEASAIQSMRALVAAEEGYRLRQSSSYGFLEQMADAGILKDTLSTGSKSGYTFITFGLPDKNGYAFIGKPQLNCGDRWFYVDQTGVIRYRDGDLPDTGSPPLN